MKAVSSILTVLLVLVSFLLAWRESIYRSTSADWDRERESLQENLSTSRQQLQLAGETVTNLEAVVEQGSIERQSLADRVRNLEAQREHLRAASERQAQRAREAVSAREELAREVEAVRLDLLERSRLPAQLRVDLSQARQRVEALEDQLDQLAGRLSRAPELLQLEGISSDKAVFALSGPPPEPDTLPRAVYLCRNNRIFLRGWIHRYEEDTYIGHVGEWREEASALVKGEKVFILSATGYEAD